MINIKRTSLIICCIISISACNCENKFLDGFYEEETQSIYTNEPYWGQVRITIKGNKITDFSFQIIDKNLNRVFDETYEELYKGNQLYINQCRNDYKGLCKYIMEFSKTKNISEIDAISGATWAYNIFSDTIKKVLIKAQKK